MDAQMPKIKVHSLILKKSPPIIGLIYSKEGSNEKLVHNVNIHIDKAKNAQEIVDELVKEETVYFGPHLIKQEQLINVVSALFEQKSPAKSSDSSGGKKKKSLRDRKNLPVHEDKNKKQDVQNAIDEYQHNSDGEKDPNDIQMIDQDYDPSKHNLQRVFIEDANQEFLMDSTGNLFDLEGNCVGKAQYDDEEANK